MESLSRFNVPWLFNIIGPNSCWSKSISKVLEYVGSAIQNGLEERNTGNDQDSTENTEAEKKVVTEQPAGNESAEDVSNVDEIKAEVTEKKEERAESSEEEVTEAEEKEDVAEASEEVSKEDEKEDEGSKVTEKKKKKKEKK